MEQGKNNAYAAGEAQEFARMIKATVKEDTWSGQGEGGTLVYVEITGWHRDDVYNSTAEDKRKARAVANFVNRALRHTKEKLV